MKTTFLISIFLVHACFYIAAADLDPVYEHYSHAKLQTGLKYYITPFSDSGSNSGLTLASARNTTCPVDVVQELKAYMQAAVTFRPVNIKKGVNGRVIRESTDLIIEFSYPNACAQSGIWKVDKYDELRRQCFVTIEGVEGKQQGGDSLRGSFRIEKEKDGYYKIVYCKQVHCLTKPCNPVCNNVGAYYQQGRVLLALADKPLLVMFRIRMMFRG